MKRTLEMKATGERMYIGRKGMPMVDLYLRAAGYPEDQGHDILLRLGPGSPVLVLPCVALDALGQKYKVTLTVEEEQPAPDTDLPVPVPLA